MNKSSRRWHPSLLTWLIAGVAWATMAAGFYTPAATWITSYNQSKVTADYASQVLRTEPDAATQLALAREYNDALTAGVIVEAGHNVPLSLGATDNLGLDYWQMLKADSRGLMARVRISAIGVDLPIYHGTSDETLLEGAGHLQGSHLPVGGEGTRTVITAHRGLAGATMFTNLDKVKIGDTFTLEVFGEALTYRVNQILVIEPEDTDVLHAQVGRDLATLITCTPLGLNTQRIVVSGERVIPTPQEDVDAYGQPSGIPRFPWWLFLLILGVSASITYLVRQGWRDGAAVPREGQPSSPSAFLSRATCPVAFTLYCAKTSFPSLPTTNVERMIPRNVFP